MGLSVVATTVMVAALAISYAGKAVCLDGELGFWADTRYCYSDVNVLWSHRGFDVDALPYDGVPQAYGGDRDYTFEYPPGLAFGAHGIALATSTRAGFFNLTALTLAAAALLTLRIGRRAWERDLSTGERPAWASHPLRVLGVAASPSLLLFAFHNWDLWATLPAVAGMALAARGRWRPAAVAFAVGAAFKWWPALLVVTLLAGPWAPDGDRRLTEPGALMARARPALLAAATWAALQVPALLVSPGGWWAAHRFHLERDANWDSATKGLELFGNWLAPSTFWDTGFRTLTSWGGLAVLLLLLGYVVWRLDEGTLAPHDAALVVVAGFLVTGRVFSPQFLVWVVPIAWLARISWLPILTLEFVNAIVWLFTGPFLGGMGWGFLYAAQVMAVARSGVLVWIIVTLTLRREGGRPAVPGVGPVRQPASALG